MLSMSLISFVVSDNRQTDNLATGKMGLVHNHCHTVDMHGDAAYHSKSDAVVNPGLGYSPLFHNQSDMWQQINEGWLRHLRFWQQQLRHRRFWQLINSLKAYMGVRQQRTDSMSGNYQNHCNTVYRAMGMGVHNMQHTIASLRKLQIMGMDRPKYSPTLSRSVFFFVITAITPQMEYCTLWCVCGWCI